MPDYTDTPGYKPPEKEVLKQLRDEHEHKQVVRRAAAERFADAHARSGPAERMYGQDRHINQQEQGSRNERSTQQAELTPAQQEMRAKREAARAEDRQQADKPYDDKKYAEIPKKSQYPSR